MGNLLGAFLGKPAKSSSSSSKSAEMSQVRSKSLSPRPGSLSQVIPLSPDGKPVEFTWKHEAKSVILTGTFDGWSQSILLAKDPENDMWRRTVLLDPKAEHQFKFVVDGVWRCSLDWETVTDHSGNVNNIIKL